MVLTSAMASFTSMLGLAAHAAKPCFMPFSSSRMSDSLRFSGPKSFDEKLRTNLWTAPVYLMRLFLPNIVFAVCGYQSLNNLPSCWKMNRLNSGSREMTTGRPTRLVLNTGPYLCSSSTSSMQQTNWVFLYVHIWTVKPFETVTATEFVCRNSLFRGHRSQMSYAFRTEYKIYMHVAARNLTQNLRHEPYHSTKSLVSCDQVNGTTPLYSL